jgi:hypothetical protein
VRSRSSAIHPLTPKCSVRIRNIEETEEQAEANKQVTAAELEAESFARERFWRPSLPAAGQSALAVQLQSDKELLKLAKEAAARGEIDEWDVVPAVNGGTRRQKASDDQVRSSVARLSRLKPCRWYNGTASGRRRTRRAIRRASIGIARRQAHSLQLRSCDACEERALCYATSLYPERAFEACLCPKKPPKYRRYYL